MPDEPYDPGEAALARRAKDNPAAFAELYRRHVDHVYRYLLLRTGSIEDAQDLTTQTFIAALEHIASYQPRRPFRMWLLGIARHKAADFFRKNHLTLPLETADDLPHPDPLPDETVSQHLQIERVVSQLHQLAPDRAEAFTLRVFGEFTAAEIAEIMGKSEAAVKMLVHRAWSDLRQRLAPVIVREGGEL
jgi:RNA polymerase sigma-70 factor (ECF subfamily)